MREPFYINEILDWIELNQKKKEWVILLVGYKNSFIQDDSGLLLSKMHKYRNIIYCMQQPLEYEDLVSVSDFFVSNCGAGSTIAPIAVGCPQMCRVRGLRGSDKPYNAKMVADTLQLGPSEYNTETHSFLTFTDLMAIIYNQIQYSTYLKNAITAKHIVSQETKQLVFNMFHLFTDIFENASLQFEIQQKGVIPCEYALD